VRRSHGGLDIEALDLLPVLRQQRHHEVDGQRGVRLHISLAHADVGHGHTEAQRLLGLELELDAGLLRGDLLVDVLVRAEHCGELASLVQTGAQQTRDQANQGGRSQEAVVRVCELLHQLLVLLELLEVILGHGRDAGHLGALAVLGIADDAHGELLLGGNGQTHNSAEALVLGGVEVLQSHLQLDRLEEAALLLSRLLQHGGHSLLQGIRRKLRHIVLCSL